MLPIFFSTTFKIAAALPTLGAVIYGLLQLGNETGFKEAYPKLHERLVDFTNGLLAVLVEHWFGWLLLSAALGGIWTVYVAEPKARSSERFQKEADTRLNRKARRP